MSTKPTPGRIVLYTLNAQDAEAINRRRTNPSSIAERVKEKTWPIGAQAHIGNSAQPGDVLPAMIIRVWGEGEFSPVNLQVQLDGCDTYWATSREGSAEPKEFHWHWPLRA